MEHGTRSMYCGGNCRCPECREANRVYRWLARGEQAVEVQLASDRFSKPHIGRIRISPVGRAVPRSIELTRKAHHALAQMKEAGVA